MKNFLSAVAVTALFFGISLSAHSQEKFFAGVSYCILSDYSIIKTDLVAIEQINGSEFNSFFEPSVDKVESQLTIISIGTVLRYNILEIGSESAISLSADPLFGLSVGNYGLGSLRVPIYVEYNFGNVSTFNSTKSMGIGIGFGMEYANSAIFPGSNQSSPEYENGIGGINPTAKLAVRYWNRNNKAFEIGFRYGFPRTIDNSYRVDNIRYHVNSTITNIAFVFTKYLNY